VSVELVAPGVQQHDVAVLEHGTDTSESPLKVLDVDCLAFGVLGDFEDDSGPEEALEWRLVDRLSGLPGDPRV
jgi:hypothetical protein